MPKFTDKNKEYSFYESDASENSKLTYPHVYCHINDNTNAYISYSNSGKINFSKINITNGIYSGTFDVKLRNKNNKNDIIEITKGRFDINLNTVNKNK